MPFNGHLCLSVTPFAPDGSLDLESLRSLIEHLIAGGIDGLIVLGSTGESFSLNSEEHRAVAVLRPLVLLDPNRHDRALYGRGRCGRISRGDAVRRWRGH